VAQWWGVGLTTKRSRVRFAAGAPLRNGDFGQVVHTHLAPLVPHSTLRTRTDRTRPNQRSDRFIVGAAFLQNSSTTCIRLRHFPLIKIIGDNRSRFSPGHVFFLSRDRGPSNIVQEQPVFEKTCATTQKNVKSHVFLKSEKKHRPTAYVQFHRPLNHSAFNTQLPKPKLSTCTGKSPTSLTLLRNADMRN